MMPTRKSFLNCSAISQPYMRASKSRCKKESAEERRVGRSRRMAPRAQKRSSRYSAGMPIGYSKMAKKARLTAFACSGPPHLGRGDAKLGGKGG